jgi:hypothetical protein
LLAARAEIAQAMKTAGPSHAKPLGAFAKEEAQAAQLRAR